MFLVTHKLDSISSLQPENDPGESCDYGLELAAEDAPVNRGLGGRKINVILGVGRC